MEKRRQSAPNTTLYRHLKINIDVPEDADVNFFCRFVYNGRIN